MDLFVNCDTLTNDELREFNELLIREFLKMQKELKANNEKLAFLENMLKNSNVKEIK